MGGRVVLLRQIGHRARLTAEESPMGRCPVRRSVLRFAGPVLRHLWPEQTVAPGVSRRVRRAGGSESGGSGLNFARRAMTMTLLHEFNPLGHAMPPLRDVATLDELAEMLWRL